MAWRKRADDPNSDWFVIVHGCFGGCYLLPSTDQSQVTACMQIGRVCNDPHLWLLTLLYP